MNEGRQEVRLCAHLTRPQQLALQVIHVFPVPEQEEAAFSFILSQSAHFQFEFPLPFVE